MIQVGAPTPQLQRVGELGIKSCMESRRRMISLGPPQRGGGLQTPVNSGQNS